jgi:hypothetical protein
MSVRAAAFAVALLVAGPAAADVTFPPGSRIGLDAPPDMSVSKRFLGFERPAGGATITVLDLPAQAISELKGMSRESLASQGFELKDRQELKLENGLEAVLFSGEQRAPTGAPIQRWILVTGDPSMTALVIAQSLPEVESEAKLRQALLTVSLRPPLGMEAQIAALPFRIADMQGFRPVRVMGGNSILLTDGEKEAFPNVEQPVVVVAQSTDAPPAPEQRDAFARAALIGNASLRDFKPERSQGFRQHGADWHEIVARATDVASGAPVVVSQTIRFAPGSYLRVVGITREDARGQNLPRFRAIADGISLD